MTSVRRILVLATLAAACALAVASVPAAAEEAPTWRLEQPTPAGSPWPISLGSVGDIEFLQGTPNRGLLITSGNPPTIEPGVWAYNGVEWHELSTVCGAKQEGRIAWAGREEFWTVSDGRPGQVGESAGTTFEKKPPLEDNTLCHFAGGQVVGSYAHPAFEANSYQAMHAAACLAPNDCWFGGEPLPEPSIGAFQLHWNGGTLEADPFAGEQHPVADLLADEGRLQESIEVRALDAVTSQQQRTPALRIINPAGVTPTFEAEEELPIYELNELARALSYLHLSQADGDLWAAAGRKEEPGQVTVALREGGSWSQLIGPQHPLGAILSPAQAAEEKQLLGLEGGESAKEAPVNAIAADPGTESAWVALRHKQGHISEPERAVLVRVSTSGEVLEEQTLPSNQEREHGIGPKGAAERIVCPQSNDCWMATSEGWLFHLATPATRTFERDEDPNFKGPITYRPPDQGLPQVAATAPPPDTSGLGEESIVPNGTFKEEKKEASSANRVTLPLLSKLHSKLLHGNTLQLRFHLAVKARLRLIAKRHRQIVAQTPTRTLRAGNRVLELHLNPARWPTSLSLQSHALAPLPTVSSVTGEGANITTESTGLVQLPRPLLQGRLGPLP
ncbi:MAG TPA: hypothetical protein VKG82_01090 [Solirubrobacteraceae bacterium]|nr:hypothetical protein [Solirubrobacteraceae bacterium]